MLKNKKVLVAGLGGTGLSVLAYCAHIGVQAAGYDAKLSDTQRANLTEKFPQFPLHSGDLQAALRDYDVLVLSPGITRRQPAIVAFEQHGGKVVGDVAILADLLAVSPTKSSPSQAATAKPPPPAWLDIYANKAAWTPSSQATSARPCWKRGWSDKASQPMCGCWNYPASS